MSPKHYISVLMMYLCKFGHNISTRCSDKMQLSFFYRGWGILASFWVWKSLLIYAYICSKYLDYIKFHLEVHSEVFQSIVFGS